MNKIYKISLLSLFLFLGACSSSSRNYSPEGDKLTVAKVQKEIRLGMSSADVIEVLGSPNIITTDDERQESWVYDKVATDVKTSSSQHGVWVVLYGYNNSEKTSSTSQRTLTIIVKFDKQNRVRDFAYRTSAF